MPNLKRAPNAAEQEKLRRIFLKAETDIINEIGRLRSMGLVDYHAVAALNRVQAILKKMESDCWDYVPKLIEKQFYARVPEARRIAEPASKHIAAYGKVAVLTGEQHSIIDRLAANLMGEIVEASSVVENTLQNALLGRAENDIYRRVGLELTANMEATGRSAAATVPQFVETLRREGVTAFVDRAGRSWSLHTYGDMVCRTTSRQAEVLAVLTADPEHDLYKISSHGTTCKICAPLEGRVYSRSGNDPDFPPLSAAFGKIDPNGADDLSNSYLNIHPNCLHVLMPWTAAGRSNEEIEEIKRKSSFRTNPPSVDPRSKSQIDAYRKKEQARAKWLSDYRQWENYRMTLGDKVPKSFETFQKIKYNNADRWDSLKKLYRENHNFLQQRLDYEWNGVKGFIPTKTVITSARTIAGAGSRRPLRVENALIERFGGTAGEWKKRVGKISSAKYDFDVHWYELNGKQYDTKLKNRKEKSNEH